MADFKIGIIGCGNIAINMVNTIKSMEGVFLHACASRSLEKSIDFSKKYDIPKAYGSYIDIVKDEEIDLIYIATPHSHHYDQIRLCLENNKNVLCEKAFTVNKSQALEVINLAKKKNLLLAEAMWTRYTPLAHKLKSIISSKIIGDIKTIKSEIYYHISHVPRVYDPMLAGGVLLDLGVYSISFAKIVTDSKIKTIYSTSINFKTGVDKQIMITIQFENDILASISCGCESVSPQESVILGTNGYIKVHHVTNFSKIEVFDNDSNLMQIFDRENQITGFEYQVLECIEAIKQNKCEVKSMTHNDTLELLEICDTVRKQQNIIYPFE